MTTLVLCVDRDNDVGVKGGVKSPIIGREDNVNAALALGLRDPEDADVNTMLTALALYDELVKGGTSAEIATICGSPSVGHQSDRILSSQLDAVLDKVKPTNAYLVSDGLEDESIFPIVSSRVKVDHVKRVMVKQSQSAEGTYYVIKKALREKHLMTPIAVILCLVGILSSVLLVIEAYLHGIEALTSIFSSLAVAMITEALGLYILGYTYSFGERLSNWSARARKAVGSSGAGLVVGLISIVPVIVGVFYGWEYWKTSAYPEAARAALMVGRMMVFFLLGIWIVFGGSALDAYLKTRKVPPWLFVVTMFLVAVWLVMYGLFSAIELFVSPEESTAILQVVVVFIICGGITAFAGALMSHRVRIAQERAARWRQ